MKKLIVAFGCILFMSFSGLIAPPEILFKHNSCNKISKVVFGKDSTGLDVAIDAYIQIINENPNVPKFEICGHASSNEKKPEALSLDRAKYIMKKLIKNGIPKNKLESKGYGTTQMLVKDAEIQKANTEQEKERFHRINRRVTIKIPVKPVDNDK